MQRDQKHIENTKESKPKRDELDNSKVNGHIHVYIDARNTGNKSSENKREFHSNQRRGATSNEEAGDMLFAGKMLRIPGIDIIDAPGIDIMEVPFVLMDGAVICWIIMDSCVSFFKCSIHNKNCLKEIRPSPDWQSHSAMIFRACFRHCFLL